MEDFLDWIRNNPLKSISGIISIVGVLISGAWAADSRWNQSDDIQKLQSQMTISQLMMRHDILEARKQELEDKIFILESKKSSGQASALDKAMLNRYNQRLKSIEEELENLRKIEIQKQIITR